MTRDDRTTAFRHAASNRKGRVMASRNKPDNALGQNLVRLRHAKRLTQREAAKIVGVSFTYLCQLETGKTKAPTVTVAIGLAAAYGISVQQIADWIEQPPQEQHTCPACGQLVDERP